VPRVPLRYLYLVGWMSRLVAAGPSIGNREWVGSSGCGGTDGVDPSLDNQPSAKALWFSSPTRVAKRFSSIGILVLGNNRLSRFEAPSFGDAEHRPPPSCHNAPKFTLHPSFFTPPRPRWSSGLNRHATRRPGDLPNDPSPQAGTSLRFSLTFLHP
jgi:hypothetical protein